jgi:7TM diverse intracellular signalling
MLRTLAILLLLSTGLSAQDLPQAERGILDLKAWNFNNHKIALSGHWNYNEKELIDLNDTIHKSGSLSQFPQIWNQSIQYATYQLTILLPPNTKNLALEIPQLYCSYQLFVNGKPLAANGKPGTTRETTTPQWLPQTVSFELSGDTLSILLHIANFYHNKGGAKEPIYLGTPEMLQQHRSVVINSIRVEVIILMLLGFSFFAIYYIREERKKITFYFSLLCFSWAIRSVFSSYYLFTSFFADFNWSIMVKIEYITLYSTMIWSLLFLSRLFPNESSKIVKYILVGLNCVFIVVTVGFSPLVFTQWLTVYLAVAGILIFFACVIVVRALLHDRSGVWFLVACLFL